jgi:ABC-type nitrate/sulfonate/bicarbonate transport system permease component
VQPFVLPSPRAVLAALSNDRSTLASDALTTLGEMLLGLLIGVVAGLALAILMAHSRLATRGLYPALIATQAIPPIALAPALVIWLGYSIWPKALVTALLVFFPVLVNAYQGLTQVEPELLVLLRSMGASTTQVLFEVRIPSAAPLLFAALRLAVTAMVIGAIFGEWVGADRGLGIYMLDALSRLQTDRVYAAIVVLTLIGVAAFLCVVVLERLLMPWRYRDRRRHVSRRGA